MQPTHQQEKQRQEDKPAQQRVPVGVFTDVQAEMPRQQSLKNTSAGDECWAVRGMSSASLPSRTVRRGRQVYRNTRACRLSAVRKEQRQSHELGKKKTALGLSQ